MKEVIDILKKRVIFLEKNIESIESKENSYPEGALRIRNKNNKGVYYYRIEKTDTNGMYMPRKDDMLAKMLAQKEYEKKYKKCAMDELNAIKRLLPKLENNNSIKCYSELGLLRKEMIDPFEIPDYEYREKWMNNAYEGLEFRSDDLSDFITDAGERVRSKSELLIANMLHKYNIPYKYECPLELSGYRIYPDFTILNIKKRKEMYWEHFGMMGEVDYCNNALRKINRYSNSQILMGDRLIATFETTNTPIASSVVQNIIEYYFIS